MIALVPLTLMIAGPDLMAAGPEQGPHGNDQVRQAAEKVDAALEELASSTQSIAREWVEVRREVRRLDPAQLEAHRRPFEANQGLSLFQTWQGAIDDVPEQQSDYIAYYAYEDLGGAGLNDAALRHLVEFDKLAPTLQKTNQTLHYSWTYLTTADDWMSLYPFLRPEEAVHNSQPSQQVYYTAANFKTRSVGWTRPYLDLVGAGMMVTAACPAYDGDELLGVASQDITLKQLSSEILSELAGDGAVVVLVDKEGLAISASNSDLESEIDRVNSETGAARLYYLEPEQLASVSEPSAVASAENWLNRAVTAVLDAGSRNAAGGNPNSAVADQDVSAAQVKTTDWWLIKVHR